MAETEVVEAATEATTEETVVEETEGPSAEDRLEESEANVKSLRAMLSHFASGVDIDAEIENIAYKRDGTAVYIGETKPASAEAGKAGEKPVAKGKTPASRTRPAENRGASGKASVGSMSDEGLLSAVSKNGMKQFVS